MQAPTIFLSINTSWNIVNFRAGLVRAMVDHGFDVVAVSPDDGWGERLGELGCRHSPLSIDSGSTSPLTNLAVLFRYIRLMGKERPAVYLGWTIKPNVYGSLAAGLFRVPVVNNVSGLGTAFIRETWLTPIAVALYRLAFSRSRVVFFQNEDDRALFTKRRILAASRTRVLPGSGIDLGRYQPEMPPVARTDDASVFLMVARLLWDKGVGEFVEAARIVRRHRPDARFQLLGFLDVENRTAVDRASVERWGAEGVVEYLGSTDDVRPFIAAADCVVLPSYREGTPRTLLEGAAMGRPLIATDVPGCREVVEDGRNGLLCNVRDAADLAGKMLQFIDLSPEERARMGRESRAKVEREFDEQIVIDRYLEVIDQILAERAAAVPWHHRLRSRFPFARKAQPNPIEIPAGQGTLGGKPSTLAENSPRSQRMPPAQPENPQAGAGNSPTTPENPFPPAAQSAARPKHPAPS
jgi:glycosyltransferase involved in cell wall biosynthesis